ncbi:MAG: hypothetical protein AAGC78_13455 [Cellvibrio sp.]|uniref:YncE family protein n=1 Tax=Cellvibrio sp. TaxID=1965322 RepID=UPI0031A3366B
MIKIWVRQFLVLVSATALIACGGGGSSGGSGGGKTSVAPVVSSSSSLANSSSSSSAQSSAINLNPAVKIQFPRTDARPIIGGYGNFTVSGIAYDDKGIRSVSVNGVAASLNTAPVAQSSEIPATHPFLMNWSATVNLSEGDTQIKVDVTDNEGVVVKNAAAPLTISNSHTPIGMVLDDINDRMIGAVLFGRNVATNLSTLTSVMLPYAVYGDGAVINKNATDIYSTKIVDGFLKLYSNKIATGVDSLVANYNLGFDPEKHYWIDSYSGAISSDSRFYFAAVRYVFLQGVGSPQIKILKIDTGSGAVSVLVGANADATYKNVSNILYVDNYLLGLNVDNYENSELVKIDTETGEQSIFMSMPRFEMFSLNSDRTVLYALTYDKFAALNLVDKTVVSKSFTLQGEEFEFPQFSYLLVDQKRNRLIVSSTGVSDIIAVDIATGERSLLVKNGIGDGISLVWPNQLEVTSDDKFAYVFDSRQMATIALSKINLLTGNRETISNFSHYNDSRTSGLALDEPNNRIFFATDLTIGIVDLGTGLQKIIASPETGLGVTMEALGAIDEIVYDSENQRLLVSSATKGFIVAVDPVTLKRTILFDSTMGSGPTLNGIASMSLDTAGKKLYLSNDNGDGKSSILAINMESGERSFVFDRCNDTNRVEHTLPVLGGTVVELDRQGKKLYVIGSNEILVHDIASNQCSIINSPADDIAILSDSTLIGLSSGLSQIHPVSGLRAVLSK